MLCILNLASLLLQSPVRKGRLTPKEAWASTGNLGKYGAGDGDHGKK